METNQEKEHVENKAKVRPDPPHKWPDWVTNPRLDPTGEYLVYPYQGKNCPWCEAIHYGSVHCPYSPAASKDKPWPKPKNVKVRPELIEQARFAWASKYGLGYWQEEDEILACNFAAAFAQSREPAAQPRTSQDYAIEHGGYLAQAAENYLKVRNEYDQKAASDGTETADDDLLSDHFSALQSAIGEFRTRAARSFQSRAAQGEWIAVGERLPKYGEWAIVVIDGVVQRMAANFSGDAWDWFDDEADSAPVGVVSHWRPLPPPPAKEGTQ